MAFAASGLLLMKGGTANGPSLWYYTSTDAHATVEGAGYFAGMGRGTGSLLTNVEMKVNDVVIAIKTNATIEVTIHTVTAVSAAGACTVSAATLA
jgi:hypothetical protein